MWDQLTIGYLAALIDGEGHIKRGKVGVMLSVTSTDFDIVERAYLMSEIGTIQGPYKLKSGKERWMWAVTKKSDVARLLCAITPLMSERKRLTQILPVAEYLSNHIPRVKICVVCGTEFIPEEGSQLRKIYCKQACNRKAYKARVRQAKMDSN